MSLILILLVIATCVLISIKSRMMRTSVKIRSMTFPSDIGDKIQPIPYAGKGLYCVALFHNAILGDKSVRTKTFYMGVLEVENFEERFRKMDEFLEDSSGASIHAIFSVGGSHKKPVLELMRAGIASGDFEDLATILRKHGMKKFIGLGHGCRQPYILIKDVSSGKVVERSGSCGGEITLSTVA